jgi:hypothetical protein
MASSTKRLKREPFPLWLSLHVVVSLELEREEYGDRPVREEEVVTRRARVALARRVLVEAILAARRARADAGRRVRPVVLAADRERERVDVPARADRNDEERGRKIRGHVEALRDGVQDVARGDDARARQVTVVCEQVKRRTRSALVRRTRRDERVRGVRPLVGQVDRARDAAKEALDAADDSAEEATDKIALFRRRSGCGGAQPRVCDGASGEEREGDTGLHGRREGVVEGA